jgi:hypothetical protein
MESVLVEKSVNEGVLFRSFSSSFSFHNSFLFINKNLTCAQPPLLPLPSVNPSWKERGMPILQHHRHKNTRHASTSPRKKEKRERFLPVPVPVPAQVSIPVPTSVLPVLVPERKSTKASRDAGEEEEVWTGTVYSVSPPPSSVPMPSFVMASGRGTTGKVTEKACGEGSGVDASATIELRKLLKL